MDPWTVTENRCESRESRQKSRFTDYHLHCVKHVPRDPTTPPDSLFRSQRGTSSFSPKYRDKTSTRRGHVVPTGETKDRTKVKTEGETECVSCHRDSCQQEKEPSQSLNLNY